MANSVLRWLLAPHLKPPGLLRLQIDRLIGRTIEIDFETRMVHDEAVCQSRDHLAGERVFLAQSLFRGKRHQAGYIRTDEMTIMNGRTDDWRPAEVDRPETFVFGIAAIFVVVSGCHAASLHGV